MTYSVKEIFYTVQGEGVHTGRASVFCRFSGCNLWSGKKEDKKTAKCSFCDTDFIGRMEREVENSLGQISWHRLLYHIGLLILDPM